MGECGTMATCFKMDMRSFSLLIISMLCVDAGKCPPRQESVRCVARPSASVESNGQAAPKDSTSGGSSSSIGQSSPLGQSTPNQVSQANKANAPTIGTIPYTSPSGNYSYTITDPNYLGQWKQAVVENIPGTQQRSDQLKAVLQQECARNLLTQGVNEFDAKMWKYPEGWFGADKSKRSSTGADVDPDPAYTGKSMYGGPCLWCARGQGSFIPESVPLPWTGVGIFQDAAKGTCSEQDFAARFEHLKIDLGMDHEFDGVSDTMCNGIDMIGQRNPLQVQPNGGIQFAWKEKGKARIHISYLDNAFKRVADDIVIEGDSIGGLVAFDDGTAILVSQKDCDGPNSRDPATSMSKAVVIYYKGGKLVFAKRLVDPYRKSAQTEEYVEDVSGNGDFIGQLDWASFVYDDTSKLFGAYFRVTGARMKHWGANMYQLDLTGKVVYQTLACSHDIGGRLVPHSSGNFPFLCVDDGFGIQRPQGRGWERKEIERLQDKFSAGWASGRLREIVNRRNGQGSIVAYLNKYNKKYYQINFMLMDSNFNKVNVMEFTIGNGNDMEYNDVHLMPYGTSQEETYLLYYRTTDMSRIKCCQPNVLGDRCFGPSQDKVYQLLKFENNNLIPIGPPSLYNMRMSYEDAPSLDKAGNLVWMSLFSEKYNDSPQSITITRMKNC